jgi:hypothetical protein
MVTSRDTRRAGEPACTIYTDHWTETLAWMPESVAEEDQPMYAALFAHLEEGWRVIRPLQLESERLEGEASQISPGTADLAWYIGFQITDNFRDIAKNCLDLLPSRSGWNEDELSHGDFIPESGELARAVRLLAMMKQDPAFPPELRVQVGPAAERMTQWAESLAPVLRPLIEVVETELYGRDSPAGAGV